MDDSRSSEIFSDNAELSCRRPSLMDATSIKELVENTKEALSKDVAAQSQTSMYGQHFGSVLEDCVNCVYQLLGKISSHLDDPNLEFSDLIHTMEDIINILQLLTTFIKNVAEAVTMTCRDMKTFPVHTGQILHAIFTHCRESQTTYGFHLKTLEQQLKDLFRSCHELQKVYLMIMEKKFVFNLVADEELDVLIEALEINLEIGEIVTSLDLKTLAEQWKAYTMVCERYSNYLLDRNVFQNCTACLCQIVVNNMNTAGESDQALLRALKVAAFAVKIVFKMCHIFRRALDRDLEGVVELLVFIHMSNAAYLKYQNKPPQHIQLAGAVINASDAIVLELLDDPVFVNSVLSYNVEKLNREDTVLGYTLLLLNIMKHLVQRDNAVLNDTWMGTDLNLMRKLFEILPYCHVYINLDLEFVDQNPRTISFYELILTHVASVAALFNSEQYEALESIMYEGILGTCLYRGMFASDLWVLMARIVTDSNLTSHQILSLCNVYKKLESNKMFANSPQHLYLTITIERLYKTLSKEEKIELYDLVQKHRENKNLWSVFKIRNFPNKIRTYCEEVIVNDLHRQMQKLSSKEQVTVQDINSLIQTINIASTCSFQTSIDVNLISDAWLKFCPKNFNVLKENTLETCWVHAFMTSLQRLTLSVMHHLQRDSECVTKILHIISSITPASNFETKLILLKIVINLSLYNHQSTKIDSHLSEIFKEMFKENDGIYKGKLFQKLRQHYRIKTVENLVNKVLDEDIEAKNDWEKFIKEGTIKSSKKLCFDQFKDSLPWEYEHKCVQASRKVLNVKENLSGSFEFDIDSVLSGSDSEQPVSKKAKLDLSEFEEVVSRIENDVAKLCDLKHVPEEYKGRVKIVCEKLNSLCT